MLPAMSGLGRLFSAASSSRGQRQLESVTEEAHTYDLLYPEAGSIRPNSHHIFPFRHGDPSSIAAAANSSDEKGGLNFQHPRDLRILVGQYIGGNSRVIYDSHPQINSTISVTRGNDSIDPARGPRQFTPKSHTAPHSRQSSFSQVAQSIFMSPSSSLSPVSEAATLFGNSRRSAGEVDNLQALPTTEEPRETEAMLLSMFGAPGFRADAGTKIHIKPFTPGENDALRPPSSGTSRVHSRRTPLTRSTTTDDLPSLTSVIGPDCTTRRKSSSILITRLFHIDPEEKVGKPESGDLKDGGDLKDDGEYSRKHSQKHSSAHSRTNSSEKAQIRTPAFAIGLVLYIPTQQQTRKAVSSRSSPVLGQDPAQISQLHKDFFDHCVDYVMARWTMIARCLASLEVIVRCQICNQLAQLDVDLKVPTVEQRPGNKVRIRPAPRPMLQLPVGALQDDPLIQKGVEMTGKRVASSLQIRLVAVGQDRWGIWREEARGVEKWAGGQEQDFFFFNLVSAFLGYHTEWLNDIGWKAIKTRYRKKHGQGRSQVDPMTHRTIIVSQDKMAARRLIFLLSIFGSYNSTVDTASGPSSTTPPYAAPSRRHSLRRSLQKARRDAGLSEARDHESAVIDFETATECSDDRTIVEAPSIYRHSRQPSDARSVRSLALPIATERRQTRNSSAATIATINPEYSVPVPHFSTISSEIHTSAPNEWRPSSSGSVASISLQRTLSRSESMDQSGTSIDSYSSGRWFWGSRRGSSTETSETPISSGEALGIFGMQKEGRSVNKLAEMVEDASRLKPRLAAEQTRISGLPFAHPVSMPFDMEEPFPLDLSVNEDDGVIDIKLPPSMSQSSSGSPRATRLAPRSPKEHAKSDESSPEILPSSPSLRRPETYSKANIGGWLRRFHPDLDVQAVQPYDTLKQEIKQAMRTEPPSTSLHEGASEWRTVSTSLVADMTNFRITLVSLRRRNALSSHHQADALLGRSSRDNPDEEFHEDTLTTADMDSTLVEAIQRVLSHSGNSSRTAPSVPSRPSSPRHSDRTLPGSNIEVPKTECKRVVFNALEQVVQSVLKETAVNPEFQSLHNTRRKSQVSTHSQFESHPDLTTESVLKKGVKRWFAENTTHGSAHDD